MKKPSAHTLKWGAIFIVLMIVLLLILTVQRSRTLQTSIQSGQFETTYTSAMDKLREQTRALRNKLNANMPGDLKILPEELLRRIKTSDEENPGEPTLENIKLRGIYWSDTLPLAEINDRLCKTGDPIAGFTLEEIQPYQIILTDAEGNRHTNSLVKELL